MKTPEVNLKEIDLKHIGQSTNNNDIITHKMFMTFRMRRSTARLLRWLLGAYARLGYVNDSILSLSKRTNYSYKTLHLSFSELVRYNILVKGSDNKFYINGGMLQGLKQWTFSVEVDGGEYPVPD